MVKGNNNEKGNLQFNKDAVCLHNVWHKITRKKLYYFMSLKSGPAANKILLLFQ